MKKLIIVNTVILTILIMILVYSALSLTNKMVYEETMDSYSRTMNVGYDTINELFISAQRLGLEICTNKAFQGAVKDSDFEVAYYRNSNNVLIMDNIIKKEYNGQNSYLTVGFYPIQNGMVYKYHYIAGLWVSDEEMLNRKWVHQTLYSSGEYKWNLVNENGYNVIRLSKLMYDMSNISTSLGVVYVDIRVEPIENVLYSSILRGKGTGYLIDENNNIILPYNCKDKLPEEMLSSKGTYSGVTEKELVLSNNFTNNNWKVAGIISISVMLENLLNTNVIIVAIGLVLGLVSMFLTSYIIKGAFNPINILAKNMINMNDGELPSNMIPPDNSGEITILYKSFNHMIDRIHELIKGINLAEKREKEAEMMALQAQINPHFLYNTLDSVNWMAMKYGANDIQSMIVSLSKMLRFSLSIKDNLIPVSNELEQVKNYIQIISVRYPDFIKVEYSVDECLSDFLIIRLVLQPLVENAIVHGFKNMTDVQDYGEIIIKGVLSENSMHFVVKNNGITPDMNKISYLLNLNDDEKSKHYGIRNVNYRLKKQYGTGLEYKIDGEWTDVSFTVPLNYD